MAHLTVGVGGSSSSGKTTLTLFLYEIFHRNGYKVFMIHEDNYFAPKISCPLTKFKDDIKGVDVLGVDCDCWNSLQLDRFITSIKYVKMTREEISADSWNMDGSTKRSISAENFVEVHAGQDLIFEMQAKVKNWIRAHSKTIAEEGGLNIGSPLAGSDKSEGSQWLQPTICLVDGFLLYTDPATSALRNVITESQPHRPEYGIRTSSLPPKNTLTPPAPLGQIFNGSTSSTAPSTDGESFTIPIGLEIRQSQIDSYDPIYIFPSGEPNITTQGSKVVLNNLFDLKLFIPVTKDTAEARRFDRVPYMDPPGGTREMTEHWKTKGYFDDVVWKNYVKEHDWLFDGDVEKIPFSFTMQHNGGIRMPWKVDADIETLVKWAVDSILREMDKKIAVELAEANIGQQAQHDFDGRYQSGNSNRIDMSVPPPVFMSRIQDVVDDMDDMESTADVSDLEMIPEEEDEHVEVSENVENGQDVEIAENADAKIRNRGARGSFVRNFKNKIRAKIAESKEKRLARKKERDVVSEDDGQVNNGRSDIWNTTILGTPSTPMLNAWSTRGSGHGFDGGSPVELSRSMARVDLDA